MFPVVSLRKGHGDDKELGPMLEDAWTAVERLRKFLQHFERKRCFFLHFAHKSLPLQVTVCALIPTWTLNSIVLITRSHQVRSSIQISFQVYKGVATVRKEAQAVRTNYIELLNQVGIMGAIPFQRLRVLR